MNVYQFILSLGIGPFRVPQSSESVVGSGPGAAWAPGYELAESGVLAKIFQCTAHTPLLADNLLTIMAGAFGFLLLFQTRRR